MDKGIKLMITLRSSSALPTYRFLTVIGSVKLPGSQDFCGMAF